VNTECDGLIWNFISSTEFETFKFEVSESQTKIHISDYFINNYNDNALAKEN
jgi:hypothetical protein